MIESQKVNIIRRAEALFFKYGIRSVTMDDIAKELGISKKTLYQNFENKNQLLTELINDHNLRDQIEGAKIIKNSTDALDEIEKITQHVLNELARLSPTLIFDLQKYHPEFWTMVQTTSNDYILKQVRENLERGIRESLYRKELNVDIISKLYVSKVYCVLDENVFPQSKYDKRTLFLEYIHYHLFGILSEYGLGVWKSRTAKKI